MAAAAHAHMAYAPFGANQVTDPTEMMETWVDFNALQSPGMASRPMSRMPTSQVDSSITSPASTVMPLEEEFINAKPSHDYQQFRQQTGIPSGTLGLGSVSQGYSYDGFSSGLGMDFMDGPFDGMNSGLGAMDMDITPTNTNMPAYFFPGNDVSQSDDFVDPSAITKQEPQPRVRVFPGMHQQQAQRAAMAKAAEQSRQMQKKQMMQAGLGQQQQAPQQQRTQPPHGKRPSAAPLDARTEELIGRVVNQIRQNSAHGSDSYSPTPTSLPHIGRMKKDEEDMDEDERLLASEEGKKLSSKERRQLRNKVSARAFRSRRKEYIGQLESEIAGKAQEANDLRVQNQALMEENARSRAFIEKLLRHPAFNPFLEDLSRDPSITDTLQQAPAPVPSQVLPSTEDFNTPVSASASNSKGLHVGMTMIPETPLDMSMLNIGNSGSNWANINIPGFNGFQHQPQIFAVHELPEEPVLPDFSTLSGKNSETFTAQFVDVEETKPEYPVIDRPEEVEEHEAAAAVIDLGEDFPLYNNSTSAPTPSSPALLFDNLILSSKSLPHFDLVVESNTDDEASLAASLEQMCSRLEESSLRLANMTSL